MFTGIIQAVGRLEAREARGGDARLRIAFGALPRDVASGDGIAPGESIAVNGTCLTVVAFDADGFDADASNETLALTTLGALAPGRAVNLERALRASDRLGGHLVSGHVDGAGRVLSIDDDGRAQRWRFSLPAALARYVVHKGSICIDGTSLTVNDVRDHGDGGASFGVALVPHTVAHTAFATTAVGDAVNLEVDQVARYLERLVAARGEG